MVLKRLDTFHHTRVGFLTFALIELALAYLMGSRALDTGSLWEYLITLILVVGGIKNLVHIVWQGASYG